MGLVMAEDFKGLDGIDSPQQGSDHDPRGGAEGLRQTRDQHTQGEHAAHHHADIHTGYHPSPSLPAIAIARMRATAFIVVVAVLSVARPCLCFVGCSPRLAVSHSSSATSSSRCSTTAGTASRYVRCTAPIARRTTAAVGHFYCATCCGGSRCKGPSLVNTWNLELPVQQHP